MNKKGFTLVEILLVITIIGALVAMVVPRLTGRAKQAKEETAKADVTANISTALDLYELDNGTFPSSEQGLKSLISKPSSSPVPNNWKGPYLKKNNFSDPWGREYQYKSPGVHNANSYDLYSLGQDGVESQDDVNNWGN